VEKVVKLAAAVFGFRAKVVCAAVLALLLIVEQDRRLSAILAISPLAPMNDSSSDESGEEASEAKAVHVSRRIGAVGPVGTAVRVESVSQKSRQSISVGHSLSRLVATSVERIYPLRC
jgi:hypothetical protein